MSRTRNSLLTQFLAWNCKLRSVKQLQHSVLFPQAQDSLSSSVQVRQHSCFTWTVFFNLVQTRYTLEICRGCPILYLPKKGLLTRPIWPSCWTQAQCLCQIVSAVKITSCFFHETYGVMSMFWPSMRYFIVHAAVVTSGCHTKDVSDTSGNAGDTSLKSGTRSGLCFLQN